MRSSRLAVALSCLALFAALGGTAVAASHYLVTSIHQIKPSVRAQLRGEVGPQGPQGQQGVAGPPGPSTAASMASLPSYVVETTLTPLTATSPTATLFAACHTGDHLLMGGFDGNGEIVTASRPNAGTSWEVVGHLDPSASATATSLDPTPSGAHIQAWAVCTPS